SPRRCAAVPPRDFARADGASGGRQQATPRAAKYGWGTPLAQQSSVSGISLLYRRTIAVLGRMVAAPHRCRPRSATNWSSHLADRCCQLSACELRSRRNRNGGTANHRLYFRIAIRKIERAVRKRHLVRPIGRGTTPGVTAQ